MNKSLAVSLIAAIAVMLVILITFFFIKDEGRAPEPKEAPTSELESSSSEITLETTEPPQDKEPPISSDNVTEDSSSIENTVASTEEHEEAPSRVDTEQTTMSPDDAVTSELYTVVDGNKLDAQSFEGFKLYRNWCARCHGTYGQGMVGPNLAESLNRISKQEFVDVVTHGKLGQIGSMPAWDSNAKVMSGMDNLYAYLKARADGAISEVKPERQ